MNVQKHSASINAVAWMVCVLFAVFMAFNVLDPLLYMQDKAEWYSNAALKIPSSNEKRYAFASKALEINPRHGQANITYTIHRAFIMNVPNAKEELNMIRGLKDATQDPSLALMAFHIERCEERQASALIEKELMHSPNSPSVLLLSALLSMQKGKSDHTIALIRKGLSSEITSNISISSSTYARLKALEAIANHLPFQSREFAHSDVRSHILAIESCKGILQNH